MSAISRGLAALPREVFHQFAVAVFIAQLVPGAGFHQVNVAVGFDRPGIDPNDANAIMQASPAERLDEGHQGRVASAAGNIVIIEAFTGRADDADDDAVVARLHIGVHQTG